MEIKEILSYSLDKDSNLLDVTFRTIDDSEDDFRTDKIDYALSLDYGFELETESFNFFDDEDSEDELISEDVELDEELLISFLNEYYMLNPTQLPKPKLFELKVDLFEIFLLYFSKRNLCQKLMI